MGERLPSARAVIETVIRLFDIDDWAEGVGRPLPLSTPEEVPDAIWPDETSVGDQSTDQLAENLATFLRVYGLVLGKAGDPRVRTYLRGSEFRSSALTLLSGSVQWAVWTRQNLPDEGGQGLAAALALMLIAQAMFVLSVPYHREAEVFPSLAFLRRYLAETELIPWLERQGAELPPWTSD